MQQKHAGVASRTHTHYRDTQKVACPAACVHSDDGGACNPSPHSPGLCGLHAGPDAFPTGVGCTMVPLYGTRHTVLPRLSSANATLRPKRVVCHALLPDPMRTARLGTSPVEFILSPRHPPAEYDSLLCRHAMEGGARKGEHTQRAPRSVKESSPVGEQAFTSHGHYYDQAEGCGQRPVQPWGGSTSTFP